MPTDTTFDARQLRARFPLLAARDGRPAPAYLDNAATAQKPDAVLDALRRQYVEANANVHRGVHALSRAATEAYEGARRRVARFIGAADPGEVVFTHGATEGINIVARGFVAARMRAGDRVVVSGLEHHSNIVPWQMACDERGATLAVLPVADDGSLVLDELDRLLRPPTRMLAVTHVSNALGTVTPVADLAARARARDVAVLVDGAQALPHLPVDVSALGCDFYVASGHKAYGPTGIGVLWGRRERLAALPPLLGGGEMIRSVSFEHTEYADPPARFEAGTPHVAGAVGLGAALEFLAGLDRPAVARHEADLHARMAEGLAALRGVRLVGTAPGRIAVQSFIVEGADSHEVAMLADQHGVAVRSGHHCAQPLMARLGLSGTVRASLAAYNTDEDVDRLLAAVADATRALA